MSEHFDIVIVGAGLSGIGAAHHIKTRLPGKSFAILESRDAIGGTWDLFRYPGIRSDSDMFTLGYSFRPWLGENSIADGASIRDYIQAVAKEDGLERAIRFGQKLVRAAWSSVDATWSLEIERADGTAHLTCGFLFVCTGYYDYAAGYTPDFPGVESFRGRRVHPQFWPQDLDTSGKNVVVIGSGATAMTLVPALAQGGAQVTMLQRSPSYVVALPAKDRFARRLRQWLPERLAYRIVRWRNVLLSIALYRFARSKPDVTRRRILGAIRKRMGPDYDIGTHFTPRYDPWDQRMCLVPDADLFKALRKGSAEIVTDEIATFTESGVRLASGRELSADVVVTATGLKLKLAGGIIFAVDGRTIDPAKTMSYKGCMFSDVPNLVFTLGYTNASWTLKCDLTCAWACRVIAHMDARGAKACVPRADPSVTAVPLIDFSSGYIQRARDIIPKQGDRKPWRLNQNYISDTLALRFGRIDDGTLVFLRDQSANVSSAIAATAAR